MTKKPALQNDTGKPTEQDEQQHNLDRRSIIKVSACTLGAVYLAPATLNMLTASRADAQSTLPPCAGSGFTFYNDTGSIYPGGLTVQLQWGAQAPIQLGPGASSTQPCDVGDNEMLVMTVPPGAYNVTDGTACIVIADTPAQITIWIQAYGLSLHIADCIPFQPGGTPQPLF